MNEDQHGHGCMVHCADAAVCRCSVHNKCTGCCYVHNKYNDVSTCLHADNLVVCGLQVKFLEVVDQMLGQIISQLHAAESAGNCRYSVCVTGDHSTPVVFGDHSHEPVPFTVAHVRHVVDMLGGVEQLTLRQPGVKLPVPNVKATPSLGEMLKQARQQAARRQAALGGRQWVNQGHKEMHGPLEISRNENGAAVSRNGAADTLPVSLHKADLNPMSIPQAVTGPVDQGPVSLTEAKNDDVSSEYGPWVESWPQGTLGDNVMFFDEISAARGSLGRFPGSEVMTLLKQFVGVQVV